MNEPSTASRLLPVFIGIALTAVLLLALGYLADRRRNADPLAEPVRIVAPQPGEAVDSPLVIRFTTNKDLALHPTGWGTDRLHLHARVGAVEHMPAAADIARADSVYSWTLSAVARGTHTVSVGWADLHHRELSAGRTPEFTVTVR